VASRFASGYQSEPFAPPSDRIADPMADIAMPALIPGDCDIGVLRRENNPRDAQKRFHTAWTHSGYKKSNRPPLSSADNHCRCVIRCRKYMRMFYRPRAGSIARQGLKGKYRAEAVC